MHGRLTPISNPRGNKLLNVICSFPQMCLRNHRFSIRATETDFTGKNNSEDWHSMVKIVNEEFSFRWRNSIHFDWCYNIMACQIYFSPHPINMLTELFLQCAFTVVVTGKPLKQDIEGMPKCDVGYKANLKWAMKDILGDQWLMASYRTKKSFVCAVHCALPCHTSFSEA